MKRCKYIAIVLSVIGSFSEIAMGAEKAATISGELGNQDSSLARPLTITITNEELDEELCYFNYKNSKGIKEISMPLENNKEFVFQFTRNRSKPFGISVFGESITTSMDDPQHNRVSVFFPKKGNSVQMIYRGLRDEEFAIEFFHIEEPWAGYQQIMEDHSLIMTKALADSLSNESRLTAFKASILIKPEDDLCSGLMFNGRTCLSVSQYPINIDTNIQCRNIDEVKNELQYLSHINIPLRKCPTRGLKAEVVSMKKYGEENETTVQQQ